MLKPILTLLLLGFAISVFSQSIKGHSFLNFDFERVKEKMPEGWNTFGNSGYLVALDSAVPKSGKYSASLEFDEGTPGFKALGFTLPYNYEGEEITLSAYLKTEDVSEGYAGLWMRLDPSVAFDNMNKRGVTGTTDWTR